MRARLSKYRKSYFILPNEVIEKYRTREISAVDVAVYAALCSLRREYDGVRISQKRIAFMTRLTEKTVSASAERLYKCGLIVNVITEVIKQKIKYKTSVYHLKPLSNSGFFFCPRTIFMHKLSPKMFVMYFFMCRARNFEYEKSWNSYNDICDKLGFGKNQRSEVVKLIGELVKLDLIKKTVRRIKKVFVDNIYRVGGFDRITQKTNKNEKRPVRAGANSTYFELDKHEKTIISTATIIPPFRENVKPHYMQCRFDF